ncbi:Zinc finger and SCAN domain-containing protein 9 [Galemys pyrenaicus]|uniref:Zinc finger and SCAN domain-containing protein 9 n=1 Tax=Galemys pyrenaicus TaxID=202257 RepID=A0A8J6DF22_GALPY|nr:Zinc finger and SCAN domain-containing protein 9 [Galemys pyrenaicus]
MQFLPRALLLGRVGTARLLARSRDPRAVGRAPLCASDLNGSEDRDPGTKTQVNRTLPARSPGAQRRAAKAAGTARPPVDGGYSSWTVLLDILRTQASRKPPKVFLNRNSSWSVPLKLFKVKMNTDSKVVLSLDVQAPAEQKKLLTQKVEVEMQESSLKGNNPPARETFRRRFRQLCYQETPGPREALTQLKEHCYLWLRPHMNTKEQILDLLVLEQFLSILPKEVQDWVKEQCPESGEEAVILLEDLEREFDESQHETVARRHREGILSKETVLQEQQTSLNVPFQPKEPQPTCDPALEPHPMGETGEREQQQWVLESTLLNETKTNHSRWF